MECRGLPMPSSDLFPYDSEGMPVALDQYPLPSPAVKPTVKDLLPRAKIQPAIRHGNDHLAAHDLPLQVRVGVALAGAVVLVLASGCVGGETLQPLLIILVQAVLTVVDEHTRRNVHRIYKGQYPLYHIPLSYH